ncbi:MULTISPECIES: patatin-like phospholipase family protein [Leptospira]|uniref:Phospholipase, patatin family n=2 Tax=Leptospira weilii TaxID=28184 RepID=N1U7H6_9LEPT|nr:MULTISPECIES: patatin-like phospholipase family protein [Leptospira]EMJ66778.1 phospholipase, patatin family [Leptospira sp. P2653]EMM70777.1 phospholipase, patatin family [Leptospira weilii str. 2006001855]EMY16448.1 phospholipase, patatin family [Leptospira weilii str. Ecochallenge]MCL8265335.1 patatin-like phospholipase family protein [Leptospira weilii]
MARKIHPEILKFLSGISLFQKLSPAVLTRIYQNIEERNVYNHDVIYYRGDISDKLFIVRHGEVMLTFGESGKSVKYLGEAEFFAENSLMTRTQHAGSAIAVMDTLLYVLDGHFFLKLAEKEPVLSSNLIRLMSNRFREHLEPESGMTSLPRRMICHVPLEEVQGYKEKLDAIVKIGGYSHEGKMTLVPMESFEKVSIQDAIRKLSLLRNQFPVIHLYFQQAGLRPELDKLLLQADQVVFWEDNPERNQKKKTEIITYFRSRIRNFAGRTIRYVDSVNSIRPEDSVKHQKIFHKEETFSRYLVSRTRGLALGGGGARALAHVGLLKVLEKENIKVDVVSGASFGAVIAALYARGENTDTIYKMIYKFFGGLDKPFDPTVPLVSFFKGKKMNRMLKDAFGSALIEDLKIPFVTSAVDLHSGEEYVMDRGPVWEALAAAMSLPGMFPPIFHGDHLLVDGGVINNVPENLIRQKGADIILSANVSPLRDEAIVRLLEDRRITGKSFFKNLWEDLKYPPILKIMGRAITLEGREITKLRKDKMDLFINLHIEEFSFFDFNKFGEIIRKGEEEAESHLEEIYDLFYPGKKFSKKKR